MKELTHLSTFSGIGGLDLAAEGAGFRTVGQCEWADYPHAVLEKHWPDVPKWKDIRTLTKESFYERTGLDTVTVLSGGFPCQPFSTAGKRRGKEDDRYLWPEMLRVISEIRPSWVVGENVAGLVSLALDTVLSDLESIGYACQTLIIPACAVDAPHRRDRCAIVAYSQGERCGKAGEYFNRSEEWLAGNGQAVAHPERIGLRQDGYQPRPHIQRDNQAPKQGGGAELCTVGCCGSSISDTDSFGLEEPGLQGCTQKQAMPIANDSWWPAEPNVGRVAHGIPSRVDRLRCLGNAVVPQQFYPIFRAIADVEMML